ncbi:MAG TPA: tRNA 2-thiouridine(34) synthase MnmA, partial [Steroidobacteraceae bacterium]|nr:tRNA 2-thiouridine(34) synthase MnmA [Steroidobacteraceae bacterium]
HYAQLVHESSGAQLHKALDEAKDQSYFLHRLAPAQLAAASMPLGRLFKPQVRELARNAGLPVYDKPDSTGICFIGERPFRDFLGRFLRDEPGPIESAEGEHVGTHRGLAFYTLGQREGLHIGGRKGRDEAPWYVAVKDSARNTLVVVQGHDHALLSSRELITGPVHWLAERPPTPFRCTVKVRYRQPDQAATLESLPDDGVRVRFDTAQRAVTPGQFAVVYDGERCLGGGVIETVAQSATNRAAA